MAPSKTATFDSHNPVTNEVIASHEIYSEAAVKAAKAVGYVNAGTVEFIFDTVTD